MDSQHFESCFHNSAFSPTILSSIGSAARRNGAPVTPAISNDTQVDDAPEIVPRPLNEALMTKLEDVFSSLGIVAYSACCRYHCSGSYNEGNPNFHPRLQGIYFIQLYLDGMNYRSEVDSCYAMYQDHTFLKENWASEKEFLYQFCDVLGVSRDRVEFAFPDNAEKAVLIRFLDGLVLENRHAT